MKDPALLLKSYLEEFVIIKLRDAQLLTGKLHCFDEHMNIILSDVKDYPDELLLIKGENIMTIGQV